MKTYENYVHKLKSMTTGGGAIDLKKLNDINRGKINKIIIRNQRYRK